MIVQVKLQQDVALDALNNALDSAGLEGSQVQSFGQEGDHEYLIRLSSTDKPSSEVRAALDKGLGEKLPGVGFEVQRLESVGPKVGADLRTKALEAMFYATLLIAVYISGRFEQRWLAAALMSGGLAGSYNFV